MHVKDKLKTVAQILQTLWQPERITIIWWMCRTFGLPFTKDQIAIASKDCGSTVLSAFYKHLWEKTNCLVCHDHESKWQTLLASKRHLLDGPYEWFRVIETVDRPQTDVLFFHFGGTWSKCLLFFLTQEREESKHTQPPPFTRDQRTQDVKQQEENLHWLWGFALVWGMEPALYSSVPLALRHHWRVLPQFSMILARYGSRRPLSGYPQIPLC